MEERDCSARGKSKAMTAPPNDLRAALEPFLRAARGIPDVWPTTPNRPAARVNADADFPGTMTVLSVFDFHELLRAAEAFEVSAHAALTTDVDAARERDRVAFEASGGRALAAECPTCGHGVDDHRPGCPEPLTSAASGGEDFHPGTTTEPPQAQSERKEAPPPPAEHVPVSGDMARKHAIDLEQCSLFVDSPPLAKAMTDAAAFLRALPDRGGGWRPIGEHDGSDTPVDLWAFRPENRR